jgi:hypothetical protein
MEIAHRNDIEDFIWDAVSCQLKVSLWRLGGWCEMAASLVVRELQFSNCEPLLLEAGNWGTGLVREPRIRGTFAVWCRYQATASGDGNRLRTLVCAWQWSVSCSHESYVKVVNKSNLQSKTPSRVILEVTIYIYIYIYTYMCVCV